MVIERGYHTTLTTVARNRLGATVNVPVTWRSLNEKIVTVDMNGRITAVDTGTTFVIASTIGPTNSQQLAVRVVWQGPAKIALHNFTPPSAVTPGAKPDSIRALVTDITGKPVFNARVAFAVTGGGGTITPPIATTNQLGIASAEWKLGVAAGVNTATATVLGADDIPFAFVNPRATTYSITTFAAIVTAEGDGQTGLILAPLAVNPAVRVVDSTGKPRLGVPVTFSTTGGGRVASAVVSTGADGVASPGRWTLGDIAGEQTLVAKVEFASHTLRATATGTAVRYMPSVVVAGTFATCGLSLESVVSCFGEQPKVGDSTLINRVLPTPAATDKRFSFLAASPTSIGHFCAVALDQSIYCWGQNAVADTAGRGVLARVPTQIASTVAYRQVAPGALHGCALASDQGIYCWGDNTVGQLGDRTVPKGRQVPGVVYGGFKFTSVTSGAGHSCGISTEGAAFCWGLNQNGQVGDGTSTSRSSPTAVAGATTFQMVDAGEFLTCGLNTLGRAFCWGNLGTGSTVTTTPKTYPTAPAFAQVTVGGAHACALTSDGTPYCWGANGVGQLGDSSFTERLEPTAVSTTLKFKSLSAGYAHTCGNTMDLAVACWGFNRAGELGDSVTTVPNRLTPRLIVLEVKP